MGLSIKHSFTKKDWNFEFDQFVSYLTVLFTHRVQVKKSLEELSEAADTNDRYRSLTEEFGDIDGGLISTLTTPSDNDNRRDKL